MLQEYKDHLKAVKDGKAFKPKLTANKSAEKPSRGKKRKGTSGDGRRSTKKRRKSPASNEEDNDDDEDDMDEDDYVASDDASSALSEIEDADSEEDPDASGESDSGAEDDADGSGDEVEEVSAEDLKKKIEDAKAAVTAGRARLNEARQAKKTASDELSTLKKKVRPSAPVVYSMLKTPPLANHGTA
jgi:hypothetical protein